MNSEIKQDLTIVVLIFLLSCIFFWKILIYPGKMVFTEYFSDVVSQFSPYKSFVQETWREYRQLPLWNPYVFMGHPFVGNPISAMFYPTSFLYLIFSVNLTFGYLFLLDIFLAGLFTYLFMKVLGVNRFGSLVSAIVFMFSGVTIMRVYAGGPVILDIIALLPLALLLIELAIKKMSIFYSVLAGIPLGLQLLAGHTEFALYSLIGVFFYFLSRSFFILKEKRNFGHLIRLAPIILIPIVVGLLLSAIQTLPSLELAKHFSRVEWKSYEFSTSYSFPPQQLMTFLIPEFFGTPLDNAYWGGRNFWELSIYVGVFSLILAFIAILFKKGRYEIIFAALAVFSLLYAFGRYSPIFPFFYHFVPFINLFRMPSGILFLTAFSLSVLSGFGSSFLTQKISTEDRKKLWILVKILSIIAVLTLFVLLFTYFNKNLLLSVGEKTLINKYHTFTTTVHPLGYSLSYYMGKIPQAYFNILKGLSIFFALLASSVFILILRLNKKIKVGYFKLIVVLIILFDLWFFDMNYINVKDPKEIFSERIAMEFLEKDKESFRVLDFSGSLPQHISMKYGVESLNAHDSSQLKDYRKFIIFFFYDEISTIGGTEVSVPMNYSKTMANPEILGLLNVKYVLTEPPIENNKFNLKFNLTSNVYDMYLPTSETKTVYVYENKEFLPRAFVVPNAKVIKDKAEILQEMNTSAFNPKEYVILEKDINVSLINLGKFKDIEITYYSPNEIHVKVEMSNPGFLVLSENWYPGWKAYDNGIKKEIYKTNYILKSIYLDKGEHEVKFIYNPLSFKLGSWITILTVFFTCGLIIHKIKTRR